MQKYTEEMQISLPLIMTTVITSLYNVEESSEVPLC